MNRVKRNWFLYTFYKWTSEETTIISQIFTFISYKVIARVS